MRVFTHMCAVLPTAQHSATHSTVQHKPLLLSVQPRRWRRRYLREIVWRLAAQRVYSRRRPCEAPRESLALPRVCGAPHAPNESAAGPPRVHAKRHGVRHSCRVCVMNVGAPMCRGVRGACSGFQEAASDAPAPPPPPVHSSQ